MNEYYLSKLIPLFLYPLGLAILLGCLALCASLLRRNRLGFAAGSMAVLVLWLSSTPVFSHYLLGTLEREYPALQVANLPPADAIIVLGGGIVKVTGDQQIVEIGPAYDRLYFAIQLYRAGKSARMILTGGTGTDEPPEAVLMANLLIESGIPAQAILVESESRNTYENATNTRAIMQEHAIQTVLLVTSASHMRRSMATFIAAGIDIIPAATEHQYDPSAERLLDWLPDAEALARTTRVCKEYIGQIYYHIRGWAD